jgi:transcriptional regulator with XRE-family HTH domain
MKRKEIAPEHKVLLQELGKRIRKLRNEKKIGYIQMAKEIGLSRNAYNDIELGNSYFNFLSLVLIAKYHDVSISVLLKNL